MEEYIRNKLITVRSSRLFHEFKTFIWHNGRPQAMRSYHDDLVMALSIACWVRDTAIEVDQRDVAYKKAMLGGMMMSKNIMNTTIKGQSGYDQSFNDKHRDELQQTKDFLWIYKG